MWPEKRGFDSPQGQSVYLFAFDSLFIFLFALRIPWHFGGVRAGSGPRPSIFSPRPAPHGPAHSLHPSTDWACPDALQPPARRCWIGAIAFMHRVRLGLPAMPTPRGVGRRVGRGTAARPASCGPGSDLTWRLGSISTDKSRDLHSKQCISQKKEGCLVVGVVFDAVLSWAVTPPSRRTAWRRSPQS